MTYVVRLSYESEAASPEGAAQEFADALTDGDVESLTFQVVSEDEEQCFVHLETGRVMDALELLNEVRDWHEGDLGDGYTSDEDAWASPLFG